LRSRGVPEGNWGLDGGIILHPERSEGTLFLLLNA
jgi:hypothetical protein